MTGSITHVQQQSFQYPTTIYKYDGEETAPHKEQLPVPGNRHAVIPIRYGGCTCNYSAPVAPINNPSKKGMQVQCTSEIPHATTKKLYTAIKDTAGRPANLFIN